ncbi:MAG: hypothetical protein ACJ72Q_06045 [Nitrososphaeraceae archaeon]
MAAGAIVAVAVAIFLIMGTGVLTNGNYSRDQSSQNSPQPIKLSIKNITAKPIGSKAADIQVVFDAYNPNKGTVILEAITYNLFANGIHLASGDIGAKLEGFIASQEGVYPIIGNGTVTLKDTQAVQQNGLTADGWSKVVNSKASYIINGTYSYKQTSSLQATGEDKDFKLRFP